MRFDRSHNADRRERTALVRGRSRRRAVVGAAAALVAAAAIAACGGSSNGNTSTGGKTSSTYGTILHGTLPKTGTPSKGGTISIGQISGQTPTSIWPLINGATCSTQTFYFVSNMYVPLYYGPVGAKPEVDQGLSAATLPQYSNNDQTVTINLKPNMKWSNGQPVDAQDVSFYMALLKAAVKESGANWCQYAPGEFPDNVTSWDVKGKDTIVLHLSKPVNPTWFTLNQLQTTNGGVYPLPSQDWNVDSASGQHITDWATNPADAKKIYDYLNQQGTQLSTFSSPLWKVVDGPYALKSFNVTNSSYVIVPNKSYGLSPKPQMSSVSFETYTSQTAMLNAMESNSLDIGTLDAGTQLGAIPKLQSNGYSVFGGPGWGWFGGFINFKNTTDDFDKVAAQAYMRGVFAQLVNQPAIIEHVYHGWAVPAYGPVPSSPTSPYIPTDATKAPWPFNPKQAVATLKAHGWDVKPGGQTTCAKAGTAKDECGAGIPAGTPIKFVWANLPESTASTGVLESQAFASEAKSAAGINVSFVTKTFNFLTANYNNANPAAAKYVNDWAVNNYGGIFMNYYPTNDGLMSPGGALNMGSYNDPVATRLMAASVASASKAAIAAEVRYFSKSYPIFYMPDQDYIVAVSKRVGGPANTFLTMTQQQFSPQALYVNKK